MYRRPDVWFTGDWHLHDDQRGAERIDNHNALVERGHVVHMIGDILADWSRLDLIERINGRKILYCGMGDAPHPLATRDPKRRAEWLQRYRDAGFSAVVTGHALSRTVQVRGRAKRIGVPVRIPLWVGVSQVPVSVAHFPYPDAQGNGSDLYAAYRPVRPSDENHPWLICVDGGGEWDIRASERMINVGIRVWGESPVPAEIIAETIKEHR